MVIGEFRNFRVTRDSQGTVSVVLDVPGRTYNVLGEGLFTELDRLLEQLERDAAARLVVFRGKESGFLAGADLREIEALDRPQAAERFSEAGQQVFDRLERLDVPTVAVIHGPCLGGGLELALACRYRVAQNDERTSLGAPEVQLGLLPAWGGTQRLPERVGLAAGLQLILDARRLSAREAVALGLVDGVCSPAEFLSAAERFVAGRLEGHPAVRPQPVPMISRGFRKRAAFGRRFLLALARRRLAHRAGQNPALGAALDAIEQGVRRGRAAGLATERRRLGELLFDPKCRPLLETFFQRDRARKRTGSHREGNSMVPPVQITGSAAAPATSRGEGRTIGAALRETARRFGPRDAMVFRQAGARYTWAEFDRAVDRVARGLLALGFRRGDHFGVWSTNWPEWVLLQFATARIGVVLVTINPAYRPAELEYALAQSQVRGLAMIERYKSSNYDAMFREVCPELESARPGRLRSPKFPRLEWIVRTRGAEHPAMLPWRELEAAGERLSAIALEEAERALEPGDPITLQYTSGTTGSPKGALLSHRNVLLNALYAGQGQRLDERDRICVPVPLYHCFGCVLGTMCAVVHGSAVVFPREGFDAESALEAAEAERCTAIYGVPTMFIVEMEHPSFKGRDLSSLRTGIMAGSPCPIELMKRVVREMGAREITIAYGQTEASPLITMTRTDDPIEKRVGTVGRPLPGIEVKIVDLANGREAPDGQSGELCCRGHNVMLGYYRMPGRTAEAIDAGGWLHTGDLGLRQPDGYYRITGRIKEMIVRGGENIAPREIEELLYQHPKVEQASVVGVPDPRFGEEVLAWIKLRAGQEASEEEIRQFCRARLAHFKTPRYVKFVDGFPTTVTGKIQKYHIRRQAIEELGLQEAEAMETA